ncbi:MAG: cysteine--tRNA ligase [Pseudomonadota bacterium]
MEDQEATPNAAHPLKLYNSLTREVEPFVPEDPSRVTIYNCGPTVWSYAHIGNARAAVVADVLFRVLRHIYGEEAVVYARNITDVDDKIIQASKDQGVPISEITEKYARIYNEDFAELNCLPPTFQPKATEHIGDMINLIRDLIDKGHAYASNGHVFFDVSTYEDYGTLSGNTLENLRGGDRVGEGEVARKKNAADFVLWKPELDGVGWDAPFGPDGANMRGRPGWHIECSAMIKAKLGETIDIHCGGVDLKFPHHENEIAQSCCGNGTESFARFWVHNEFLNMGKDKMSKSLGNVRLVHDLLKEWDGEVIRLALLKAHYRSELSWSEDLLRESKAQLDGWYRVKAALIPYDATRWLQDHDLDFLNHDLGTPLAIKRVGGSLGEVDKDALATDQVEVTNARLGIASANLLGLLQRDPDDWFAGNASDDDKARFDALASARHAARQAKDWAEADRIRDEGKALGIVFEDGKDGTTWRKA